jgi:putative pyruvate formate lyase activating enzyme
MPPTDQMQLDPTSDPTLAPRTPCRLCPRACGANRWSGQRGYCGAGLLPRVFRHGPHFGEEPPLSGSRGSGTIFFSHCTMRCLYCQNYPWSQQAQGEDLEIPQLSALFRQLAASGCHNWNLVSPTPWLPQIRDALFPIIKDGIRLPIIYNSSGFESPDTLASFQDLADIALVDLRYARDATATEASDCPAYVRTSRATLTWFWQKLGALQTDSDGHAVRGVICRVLVLPGHADEAVANLHWLADHLGSDVSVSVMAQYTPVYGAQQKPGWNRRITAVEYEQVTRTVEELGFDNGWIQEWKADDTPDDLLGCNMPAGEAAVGREPTIASDKHDAAGAHGM